MNLFLRHFSVLEKIFPTKNIFIVVCLIAQKSVTKLLRWIESASTGENYCILTVMKIRLETQITYCKKKLS